MKRYLIYITIASIVVLSIPSFAAKGGGGRQAGVITVPDTVHGGTTTATVNPGGDVYVFVQCYTPQLGGEYVYAKYFDVIDNTALLGPLQSRMWQEGAAGCRAQEGYFMRDGFGKWVVVAETTFNVSAG
jgi:hypothetical protein